MKETLELTDKKGGSLRGISPMVVLKTFSYRFRILVKARALRMFLPDWKATSPIKVWIELIEFGRNIGLRHIHEK